MYLTPIKNSQFHCQKPMTSYGSFKGSFTLMLMANNPLLKTTETTQCVVSMYFSQVTRKVPLTACVKINQVFP